MNLICLDFETFFSDDYTLKKLTTEAYIRDPRFEGLLVGIKAKGDAPYWVPQEMLASHLAQFDWSETAVIAHHAHFDGLILSHHFGIKPAFWFCTLSMARLIHGNHIGLSLGSLAGHYNLQAKTVPYDLFKGKRWKDLSLEVRNSLGEGACHDVALTFDIFQRLAGSFPSEEYVVVDSTIRFFTEPSLVGDASLFAKVRDESWQRKNEMLYELGVGEKDLASADKFVRLLEAEGVEVPLKKGKKKMIPCVAATDPFMKELENDENPRVANLARARIDVRSTINETRAGRLAGMAERGVLPVYLSYCGAHTTRWSGGDRVNFQNLTPELRPGVRAPEGYRFGRIDQSQGECRVLNWLAGQWGVVERFKRGEDPYLPMASAYYRREITKVNKLERQLGKVLELMCGFGAGDLKIQASLRRAGLVVELSEAKNGKDVYRNTHREVVAYWNTAEWMLRKLVDRSTCLWGPMEIRDGRIYLPNGAWLDFTSLKYENAEWSLHTRYGWTKYYGAKLIENVVQALSRVITSQAMIKIRNAGIRVVGCAHDDLWFLAPIGEEEKTVQFCIDMMAMTPSWAPGLPLGAEGHLGQSYGG